MALSIKNKEVEELARELARVKKLPITKALHELLKREVSREKLIANSRPRRDLAAIIMEIGQRSAARPVINDLSEDEILGYDEFGAPSL
jgi:antitoxin VapB